MHPRFTSVVAPLPSTVPFVGPEAQERARSAAFNARIGANESVFGPSLKAIAAMRQDAAWCWMYCDPENHDLKTALAQEFGLAFENIVVSEGIDSLFGYTVRLFVAPGDTVVSSLRAYPTFNFHVAGYGAKLVTVPYVNGLVPLPSATNFVTIDCGRNGAYAKRILDGLIARGIFVRMPGVAPLNRCIRVSAGTEADLATFAEALPKALADAA